MMANDHIIDVSELNFQYEVLAYSQNTPVLVDFWAEWCQPCKVLGPLLERIVAEAGGSVRLARLNIDQNPNLAMQYGVRSIPTVKAFVQGQVAGEFVGLQPEVRIREFISKIVPPSPLDLALEKAHSLLTAHDWKNAEILFLQVLEQKPSDSVVLLGLAKSRLAVGNAQDALEILKDFPPSRESTQSQILLPYARSLLDYKTGKLLEQDVLDTAFNNCLRLASTGKIEPALDGLLDILRKEKSWREKLAQKSFLALLELLGEDDPQTRQYRQELASILF